MLKFLVSGAFAVGAGLLVWVILAGLAHSFSPIMVAFLAFAISFLVGCVANFSLLVAKKTGKITVIVEEDSHCPAKN